MVTSKQVVAGVLEYADRHIMPMLDSSKQFLAGMALGIAGGKAEALMASLSQQPMIAALGIVQPNGDVDLETLYAAAGAQLDKQKNLYENHPATGTPIKGFTFPDWDRARALVEQAAQIADSTMSVPVIHPMLQPSLSILPLQLFSYYMALARGCDVDKPRNLAKSVTVE